MTHPKFKIMEIKVENGNREESIFSKQLMFKNDAERVMRSQNRNYATYTDIDNAHYWIVVDKNHNAITIPALNQLDK